MVGPLGFELLPDPRVDFDGVPYYATQNDFGPSSIDGGSPGSWEPSCR